LHQPFIDFAESGIARKAGKRRTIARGHNPLGFRGEGQVKEGFAISAESNAKNG